MADDLNMLLEQLRQRNAADQGIAALRRQEQSFNNLSQSLPQGGTVGGQTYQGNIGGRSFAIPTEQKVDWGSILGRFGANYMAARSGKKADDLIMKQDELNQQFFASTMRDDPKAQRLYMMHQAGVPGADKALGQHLAPKKEALAGLTQLIASGKASPELVASISDKYGIDPQVAASAAQFATEATQREQDRKFDQQVYLKKMGLSAAEERQARDLAARGKGSRIGIGDGMSESNEAINDDLTPGERQVRAKQLEKFDENIMKAEQQLQKFNGLRGDIEKDNTFGMKQKVADVMAKSPIGVISAVGTSMRNKSAMLLEDYLNSETLTRMAQLGGNDSNEDLNRMRASLPQVVNNKEAALHLMDQLNEWQKDTKKAIQLKRKDYATGNYFKIGSQEPDYYKEASKEDPTNKPTPAAPSAPKGKIKILSID
jgi:uncharacterized protein YidB (DUF937 family)